MWLHGTFWHALHINHSKFPAKLPSLSFFYLIHKNLFQDKVHDCLSICAKKIRVPGIRGISRCYTAFQAVLSNHLKTAGYVSLLFDWYWLFRKRKKKKNHVQHLLFRRTKQQKYGLYLLNLKLHNKHWRWKLLSSD